MEGFSFEGRNSIRSTRQGASRFNAAENKNNVSMGFLQSVLRDIISCLPIILKPPTHTNQRKA